jgi:uncharacterized delta-60 repeat protein
METPRERERRGAKPLAPDFEPQKVPLGLAPRGSGQAGRALRSEGQVLFGAVIDHEILPSFALHTFPDLCSSNFMNMKNLVFGLLLCLLAGPLRLSAQSANLLDPSWDGDGVLDLGAWTPSTRPLCRFVGDQLYVGIQGTMQDSAAVMRYATNGTLDPGFDQDGIRRVALPGSIGTIRDIQVSTAGEVYLLGTGQQNFIKRLLADGSDDPTFQVAPLPIAMTVLSIQLLDDGRMLACGHTDDAALVCYLPSGALDVSFGQGGFVTLDSYQDTEEFSQAGSMSNHNIVVCGKTLTDDRGGCGSFSSNIVAIYTPQGQLIYSNILSGGSYEGILKMEVLRNGGFLLGGSKMFRKFDLNGNNDPNFSAYSNPLFQNSGSTIIWAMREAANGRLIVSATRNQFLGESLMQFHAHGAADAAFGPDGELHIAMGYSYDLFLQSDGKILVAGQLPVGPSGSIVSFVVARYNGSAAPLDVQEDVSPTSMSVVAYPNPSHGQPISLDFNSPKSGSLRLACRDIAGREVTPSTQVQFHAGSNQGISLPGSATLASGVYFLQVQADGYAKTLKLVVD